jgi:hypothetical protein
MTTEVKRTKRQQTAHEKKVEKVALALRKFLEERGLWAGCQMYYNGKKIRRQSNTIDAIEDGANPHDVTEYGNPDTITLIFEEGELYGELNYGTYNPLTGKYNWKTTDALHTMLEKLGWYYELGHAWNLSLFDAEG